MITKLLDILINKRKPVKKDKSLSTDQLHDQRREDVFPVMYLMGMNR